MPRRQLWLLIWRYSEQRLAAECAYNKAALDYHLIYMPRSRSNAIALGRLLSTTNRPIYVLDDHRTIVYCNAACTSWTGLDLDQLIQQRCDYHSSAQATGAAAVAAALCPPPEVFLGHREQGILTCRRPSGEVVRRRADFLPLTGDALECVGVLVVVDEKPWEEQAAGPGATNEAAQLHHQLTLLRHQLATRYQIDQLVGHSVPMRRVRAQLQAARQTQCNVLVVGPRGSGRLHVARTIHHSDQLAPLGHLVPLACPLLDAELLQSTITEFVRRCEELPPQESGALILQEVDQLSVDAQHELAGFLELPEFHLRLISTARTSLIALAEKELFRSDLAFPLSTLVIELPPLGSRAEDIPLLAQHFLEEHNAAGGRQLSGFTSDALDVLAQYWWPQNIDELAKVVRTACSRAEGPLVGHSDLPQPLHIATDPKTAVTQTDQPLVLDEFLADVEKELLERALRRSKGNKAKAARLLGVTRARLHRRMNQFGLE